MGDHGTATPCMQFFLSSHPLESLVAAPAGQYACDALISTAVLRFVPGSWLWGHVTVSDGRQLRALPCSSCQGLSAHADEQAPV